jgi:exosortase/archaeosortase family protein
MVQRSDFALAGVLVALGAFIWWNDPSWRDAPADTLPVLAALPIYFWLGSPWRRRPQAAWSPYPLALGFVLFPLGLLLDSTFVQAAGWTALLWAWTSARFEMAASHAPRKLLLLPLLAFPWLAGDFVRVGWWFRLSGAAAAEQVLAWAGFDVARSGTFLVVNGFRASVEAACSGLNGLQAMLVAGVVVAHLQLRHSRLFWWNLPLLIGAAWLANALRIIIASAWAASVNPAFAQAWIGPLHLALGWIALGAVFIACAALFALESRLAVAGFRSLARLPWLEVALVGYALLANRALVGGWRVAPYDRFGWIAFLIWLVPLARRNPASTGARRVQVNRPLVAGLGLAAVLLGQFVEFNVARQTGLALILISLAPWRSPWIWAACACAWLPATGWLASRFAIDPTLFALCRVSVAFAGVASLLYHFPHYAPTLREGEVP